MIDPAPYVPLATAIVTLLNTVLLIWNRRKLHRLGQKVNGMYLQTLAEAEQRGRRQARHARAERPGGTDARPAPSNIGTDRPQAP